LDVFPAFIRRLGAIRVNEGASAKVKPLLTEDDKVPFRFFACRTAAALIAIAAPVLSSGAARAEVRLDARFTASLAGVPIGKGVWQIDVADDQYTAAASGRTSGFLAVFSGGHGTAASRGTVKGSVLQPAAYASNVVSDKKSDEVRMALSAGNVKEFSVEPPLPPVPDRIPVTDAHRRGVIDPMTGALIAVGGNGDTVTPEACRRTMPIFDGRGRFDLTLSFKRMDRVKSEKGYDGPVLVCSVSYRPIAGHRANRAAIRYLMETRDIEVWYAPVTGTRILAPYRISIPTALGAAVLEANTFVAAGQNGRLGPAPASVKTQ
jgi:hypothetical protein